MQSSATIDVPSIENKYNPEKFENRFETAPDVKKSPLYNIT